MSTSPTLLAAYPPDTETPRPHISPSLVNRHNHTGLVVKPGCSRSLSAAMNRILSDNNLYERFAANGFQHYQANFTEAAQGYKYSRVYRSLLKNQV